MIRHRIGMDLNLILRIKRGSGLENFSTATDISVSVVNSMYSNIAINTTLEILSSELQVLHQGNPNDYPGKYRVTVNYKVNGRPVIYNFEEIRLVTRSESVSSLSDSIALNTYILNGSIVVDSTKTVEELSRANAIFLETFQDILSQTIAARDQVQAASQTIEDNIRDIELNGNLIFSGAYVDVTTTYPLTSGYYNLSSALSKLTPTKDLSITFESASDVWESWQYEGTNILTASWTNTANWTHGLKAESSARVVADEILFKKIETARLESFQKSSWPFADTAECLSSGLSFLEARTFIADLYLTITRNSAKQYSVKSIARNVNGIWSLGIYSETPVETGEPTVYEEVARFSTSVNPENGNKTTIHELKSGGVTVGKIAVRWSALTPGTSLNNLWASGSYKYRLSNDIFDKEWSQYIRPIERQAELITYINEAISAL